MNHDPKVTEELKAFVHAEEKNRDYNAGANLLLRISGNRVEYQNVIRNLEAKKSYILQRLRRLLEFRLAALTKEEVREMAEKAEKIATDIPKEEEKTQSGKRADHDSLPEEIQAAYTETLDIFRRQQQLHLEIRRLALRESTCPESDLFPFVKDMIDLDKKRLSLWRKYDSYKASSK